MTTPTNKSAAATWSWIWRWLDVLLALAISIVLLPMVLTATGCRTRLVVLPSDRTIQFLPKGETFTATNDTYLVPPALMRDLVRTLNRTNTP